VEVNGAPEGIWPKGQVDCGQPLLACMEELLPCTLLKVPDGLFCNAILEVGVNPTEGEPLPLCTAAVFGGVVCKLSVVAVAVEDADAVLPGKVFEGSFGFHCFFGGELGHEVDVLQSQVVVNKDGGHCIAFLGKCSLQLGNEAHLHQNHLIGTNTLSCFHCHKHFGGGHSSFLGNLGHGTKEASRAGRRLDLGQPSRDLAIMHELLELGEG
jgi:hypothetical protein